MSAAAKAAGLGEGFTGHSGRVGMAQDLSASGVELPELMTAGRWKSSKMPARYTERQAAGRGRWPGITSEEGVNLRNPLVTMGLWNAVATPTTADNYYPGKAYY